MLSNCICTELCRVIIVYLSGHSQWMYVRTPERSSHDDNNSRISLAAGEHRVFPDARTGYGRERNGVGGATNGDYRSMGLRAVVCAFVR